MYSTMKRSRAFTIAAAVGVTALMLVGCANAVTPRGPEENASSLLDENGRLKELTEITVTVPAATASLMPLLMAESWPEFAEYNLKVNVETLPSTDALVLLAQGKIDGVFTGVSAGMLNAIAGGNNIKAVLPGSFYADDSPSGWYVSKDRLNGKKFKPAMLEGETLASSQGATGSTSLGLTAVLGKAGLVMADVVVNQMPSTDIVTALENGAIFAGVVTEPLTEALVSSGKAALFAPLTPPDVSATSIIFGPTLLNEKRDVGQAFVNAVVAIYKNHLQGDYIGDAKGANKEAMIKALQVTPEQFAKINANNWPTEPKFPADLAKRYQDVWSQIPDTLNYDKFLTQDQVIDNGFLESLKTATATAK